MRKRIATRPERKAAMNAAQTIGSKKNEEEEIKLLEVKKI